MRNVKFANPDMNPDIVSGLKLPESEFQQSGHESGHRDRIGTFHEQIFPIRTRAKDARSQRASVLPTLARRWMHRFSPDFQYASASFANHLRLICARFSMTLRSNLPWDCPICARFAPNFVVLSARSIQFHKVWLVAASAQVKDFAPCRFRISGHESEHYVRIAEPKQAFPP